MMKNTTLVLLALASAALLATPATAQTNSGAWRGQDNEFGSIRAPYTADMKGSRVPIEAKTILRENYEEKDSRFFMFAWTVEATPLDVELERLVRTDTGEELPCYQRQGDAHSQVKCFVDLKDMPPEGTEILMTGTVGSSKTGSFQVGAIVVPFTYTWMRVPMSNGLDAELYGYTLINVATATSGKGFGGGGNAFNVPSPGVAGALLAVFVAAAAFGAARRKP